MTHKCKDIECREVVSQKWAELLEVCHTRREVSKAIATIHLEFTSEDLKLVSLEHFRREQSFRVVKSKPIATTVKVAVSSVIAIRISA